MRKDRTLDITQLAADLLLIATEFSDGNIQANTFLRIGKPTTENLRPYKGHYGKFEFFKYLLYFTIFLPVMVFQILREIGRFFYFKEWRVRQINLRGTPCGSVFVSHYTHANRNSLEDFYFGSVPSRLNSLGDKSSIFLLNHTTLPTSQVLEEYCGNQSLKYLINMKTVPLAKLLKISVDQLSTGTRMMLLTTQRRFNPSQRFLLAHAALQQLSRTTYAVAILNINLGEALSALRPSRVFITLEGHSYEAVLLKMIHKRFPNVRVFLYQHAPIVPNQFGLLENLREVSTSDLVLTTGQATKEYFEKISGLPKEQIRVLGSPKSRAISNLPVMSRNIRSRQIFCLFAPEASIDALNEMMDAAITCCHSLPGRNFILRLHPAFQIENYMEVGFGHELPINLIISKRSLEEDLMNSEFCVYRSTAVAIEGLVYATRPIHYSNLEHDGLDPLSIMNLAHPRFSLPLDLVRYLEGIHLDNNFDPSPSDMIDAYLRYFAPIDDTFLDIL